MIVLAVALALSASTATDQERASETGRTLGSVDALRAQGAYQEAAAELRGWLARWSGQGHDASSMVAEAARMRALMRQMVAMQALLQEASHDETAARGLLAALIDPARPTPRTAEQARALELLSRHDPFVRKLLDAAFPAQLVLEVDGPVTDEHLLSFPLENALIEVSRDALPVGRGPGASQLRVRLTMRENDTSRSALFAGTSMKSYAVFMSAEMVAADGASIARAATSTAVLGINAGYAARSGMSKCGQLIYQQLVDAIAARAAAGGT